MKRGLTIALTLMVALSAGPVLGQETVRGFFEGPLGGENGGTGVVTLTGWAVADSPVRRVVIQVDGVDIGAVNYGLVRPDVTAAVPGFPDSGAAGFGYNLNTTDFLNGEHTLSAKVITSAGTVQVLAGTRDVFFTNNTSVLIPFGDINRPTAHTELFGVCNDPDFDFRRYVVVSGWALDLGVEIGDTGVAYAELMLDGARIASTRLAGLDPLGNGTVAGCHFDADKGGLSNCYGFPRLDVERAFPYAFDAPSAGYRFVIDVGDLVGQRLWPQGQHVLKVRVGDIAGQVADVDEIPVFFRCIDDVPNETAIGRIETPRRGRVYAGVIKMEGWALDWEGVDAVHVFVDGSFEGAADYGPGLGVRGEVQEFYPSFPDTSAPVWRFFFDTTEVSDGERHLEVFVIDDAGASALIGETTFFVNNQIPD